MRVAYVGNFQFSHCTETHLALTLENLGHEVVRVQEDNPRPDWFDILLSSDLVLFTRTWGNLLKLEHLAHFKEKGITTASYHLDLYVGLERKYLHEGKSLDEVLQTDPFWRTDYVFTPDGHPASQVVFKKNGVNHYYMKPGVFKPECIIEPYDDWANIGNEIVFVGGGDRPGRPYGYGHPEWPYRDKLIGWLYDTYGDRFTKYGHPQETIRNKRLNQLYANSKIIIGDSVCLNFDHTYYWSDRIYETLGRGGFIIHPYIKGLEEEFADGENIVFYEYDNWDQLKKKIGYYLKHDIEREKIRLAGHEFVKNNATYTDRLTQMLEIINAN